MIIPVILSGGSGSRLWPLSRATYPKQFLPLASDNSMLQDTVLRLQDLANAAAPMVVCNEDHRFMVAEQLRALAITPTAVILEPIGRNTAPATAVAALQALTTDADAILLILPADHLIQDAATFRTAVAKMQSYAEDGQLITFGIEAQTAETGYGYIQAGPALADGVFQVARFVEKPDLNTAEDYLATGGYYWNSGMFMFRADAYLAELERLNPTMLSSCRQALSQANRDLDFLRLDTDAFANCPSDSIDYAVMEKTSRAIVTPLSVGWNDVGAWSALWEVGEQDETGNVTFGDVMLHDSRNSYLHAQHRLVACVGVEDVVVVETSDAVLVAHRDRVQDVKTIVDQLKQSERSESRAHRKIYRPWGAYDSIDTGERFQVKHITVNPGASLSLQMHHHRAEHWIVVTGTALVTCDEREFMLHENESTYLPMGAKHRLVNPGKIPLELIEVQSGSYLGEDDIVRFDDIYGREGTNK